MNENITLKKLAYDDQIKIIDIINNDKLLKDTFGGMKNTITRIFNSSYVGLIQKDDSTIGFIMLVYNKTNNYHELDIGIINNYRNQGYGTKALNILKNIITKENIDINIQIKKGNISARKIAVKNNFILVKQDSKYIYYSNGKKLKK